MGHMHHGKGKKGDEHWDECCCEWSKEDLMKKKEMLEKKLKWVEEELKEAE